jgi:hypothetical protein
MSRPNARFIDDEPQSGGESKPPGHPTPATRAHTPRCDRETYVLGSSALRGSFSRRVSSRSIPPPAKSFQRVPLR